MTKPLLASADLPVLGREGDAQAAPSGERTMAAGHITARLRVVSKCALTPGPIKKERTPWPIQDAPDPFPPCWSITAFLLCSILPQMSHQSM